MMKQRSRGFMDRCFGRSLRVETLEDRIVLSATLQQAGISQAAIDLIYNNPYSSEILADETLQNTLDAIVSTQTPTGVTDVINTDAGLLTIATGGTGKTYLIQGDRTLANGTEIDVPANTTIYVDGSIYKEGTFTAPGGVHSAENTGPTADVIFRVEEDNVSLIGVNNALLHSNAASLSTTVGHATAVYIDGGADNVLVDGFEIANVWEAVAMRFGTSNVTTTNNYIQNTVNRAIWHLGSDFSETAHNFIVNPGVDGIDFDAFTESNIAYENVVIGAGRWAGFVEEGTQNSYFIRGLAIMADMGNPNTGFQLGWADNGTSQNFVNNNPGIITENNYFIDNVVFEGEEIPPPPPHSGASGDYFAKENAAGGQTYFWANRGFGAGQSATNFFMAEWLTTVPTSGGPGGTINGVQILANLDSQYNSFTIPPTQDISGDFDNNSIVDRDDLIQWRGDYGANSDSDADGDGLSTGLDFLAWQTTLGNTAPPDAEGIFTLLDTDFTESEFYTSGNLGAQEPFGSSSGKWLGQANAQVSPSGSGSASSVGGPFDRNTWSIGATGGQLGVPSTSGFSNNDRLSIAFDYQFDLGSNVNTGLGRAGFRDEGPNAGNSFDAAPQQGFKTEFNVSGGNGGNVKFFPDLGDSANVDALILDGALLGIDPGNDLGGGADLSSDKLRIFYQASTDGAGNWTVDSFSVVNLDTEITYDYTGPVQTFFFEDDALPGTPVADAFYAQQLAFNSDAGFTGTSDGSVVRYITTPPPPASFTDILNTGFTSAEGYVGDGVGGDDPLPFQSPAGAGTGTWLGQTNAQVNAAGTGTVTSVGGPFDRNTYSAGANGGSAGGGGTLTTSDFTPGDQLRITFDYQFTLSANATVELASIGFRDGFGTTEGQSYGFNAVPQQGWDSEYNAFGSGIGTEPNVGGSVKFFPDKADSVNADALIIDGNDLGVDPNNGLGGGVDLISDNLQITYVASYNGGGNWSVDSLSVENLDTSTTFDYAGPTQSFDYFASYTGAPANTPAADAFYAQQLAINSDASFLGVADGARFEFLDAAPLSGLLAGSTSADGKAANPALALNGLNAFAEPASGEEFDAVLTDQAFVAVEDDSASSFLPLATAVTEPASESAESEDGESVDEAFATLELGSPLSNIF